MARQTVREGKLKEDLMSAAFVLKAVLSASLSRKEIRGAFSREDFPQQDDLEWPKNSCLAYDWQASFRLAPTVMVKQISSSQGFNKRLVSTMEIV